VLVRIDDDGALAIGQLSHSWLSGQLAQAWGNERFTAPEPREQIALGAEQHDIGWALFDLEPQWDERSRLPRSFLEISVEQHLAIWRRAPDQLMSASRHAALVVSMHGRSLSELRAKAGGEQAAAVREHIAAERERQARLSAALGISDEQAKRTQRQMWTWDGLSLALCHRWTAFTARDVPCEDGLADLELRVTEGDAWTLDPWPFGEDRVLVRCEGRRLDSGYDSEGAMREAFDAARPLTLEFALERS
jgi:hypothetical protein